MSYGIRIILANVILGPELLCQTLSGLLPRSGSPAREARGAAAKLLPHKFSMILECENGPQRQAII